ncbi:MAG: large subunit ribosomal protein L24 [Microgenomates group bacterium Gr01-1014_93]|nr:MAG: large subunit ribosomal protein L24 [Microgenomates group bacterium Gr01-1014_93]
MKIKKGDTVQILLGKDRGKSGKVLRILTKKNHILVEGINKVKRHIGKKVTGQEGTVLELPKPVNLSNVSLICPNCKKATRVGFKVTEKTKIRICKKCKKEIIEKESKLK